MGRIELLKELYEKVELFPYTSSMEEAVKISIEVDGRYSKHSYLFGKWEIIKKLWQAKEYISFHVSRDIYYRLNDKVVASNIWLDIDAEDIVKSTKQLIGVLDVLENELKMERDKDFYVKYSGNKGYHILIPHWKFPDREFYSLLVKILKFKLSKYNIDWHLLTSSHHLIRDFWAYNPKSDKISLYIPKEYKISKIVNVFSKLSVENVDIWVRIDKLLREKINYDVVNKDTIEIVNKFKDQIKMFEKIKSFNPNKYSNYYKKFLKKKGVIFPEKVKEILMKGIQKDGRERFLFLLATVCKANGFSYEEFEQLVKQWNEKNYRKDERDWSKWVKTLEYQMRWYKKNWNNLEYKIPSKREKGLRYWTVE